MDGSGRSFICARSAGAFAPGGTPQYHPDAGFATRHVRIALSIDVRGKTAFGSCAATLESLGGGDREVRLDAVGMKVAAVRLESGGGSRLRFSHERGVLRAFLPRPVPRGERVTVSVSYSLKDPAAGLTFIGPDKDEPGRPLQVWSQGQTDDSRFWFPCRDVPSEKATTEVLATVPEDFTAVSNGELVSSARVPGRRLRTWHWRMAQPHSLYLVTLAVGRFSELRDEWDGIPVTYYCERGREADARRGFGKTPDMVRFFSERIGVRYPWPKYAQVAMHEFGGGMENTSAATQTDMALLDRRAALDTDFDGLVAHELAHQWFGDLVTCRSWSHGWLNEGFASYFDPLYQGHALGEDAFHYDMHLEAQAYFDEDSSRYSRPIVTNVYKHSWSLFDRHLYQKAAWVLHGIRYRLGDELWWAAVKHYVERFSHRCVETSDFVAAVEEATGRNIRPMVDRWVYGAGHPEYRAAYRWDQAKKEAVVWITQRQKPSGKSGLFSVALEFRFETDGVLKTFKKTVDERERSFRFKLPEEPTAAWIDPDHWVLKELEFSKPASFWRRQLRIDRNIMGRVEAAGQISRWKTPESVSLIEAAFHREKFWAGRYELAKALGRVGTSESFKALQRLLKIADHRSRRGVAEALAEFPGEAAISLLMGLARKDPALRVRTASLRCLGKLGAMQALPLALKALSEDSWGEVIRRSGVTALASLQGTKALARLKRLSMPDQPTPVRLEAADWLGRLGFGEEGVFELLERMLWDSNRVVVFAAVKALEALKDDRCPAALKKLAEKSPRTWVAMIAEAAAERLREGLDPEPAGRSGKAAGPRAS
ncbi:MAG: HEAT repeat domain-containing protein [Elusimicrobia bacterium]|nr:HEAT repeat domain-containing protein [Elusimicrobiota bacterium]